MAGKIDAAQLREMIRNRKTAGEICAAFGCTNSALTKFRHAHGIPKPVRTYRGLPLHYAVPTPAPVVVAPEPPPRTRASSLIDTGGRYADLRAWAAEWGVSETNARLEWHRLRLPVSKGGQG